MLFVFPYFARDASCIMLNIDWTPLATAPQGGPLPKLLWADLFFLVMDCCCQTQIKLIKDHTAKMFRRCLLYSYWSAH